MGVVNVRDVMVLALLRDGAYSKKDIIGSMDIPKTHAERTLGFLKSMGLVERTRHRERVFYSLTASGKNELKDVYRKMGKLKP